MIVQRNIKVKTSFEQFHSWPEAPDEVAFLRNKHRHIFNVIATLPVEHGNRELEYFMVVNVIDRFIVYNLISDWKGTESCEMIAELIAKHLIVKYDRTELTVEVNEDGENGSIVTVYNS